MTVNEVILCHLKSIWNKPVWREAKGRNNIIVIESVQMFAIIEIPEHGFAVFTATGAQRTVGRHGHRVQVPRVPRMVDFQAAIGQIPHLDETIPTRRDDDRIRMIGRKSDARHPIGVSLILYRVLALGQSVPQLYRLIPRTGHYLAVIHRKGDAQHVLWRKNTNESVQNIVSDIFRLQF